MLGKLIRLVHTEKYFLNLVKPNQNLDCNYSFQINLAPNGGLSDAKSIENMLIQSKWVLN